MNDASRAIYAFRRNLVLAASAGTGKTHALVGVAVHLLMGACRSSEGGLREAIVPEALVATTFSRKAAGEIRLRLTDELGKLASGDSSAAYRADLLAACVDADVPLFTDEDLALRARRALGRIGRAKIGTLHSFAASIVRTHALAAGLSPDFDLPDEETLRERAASAIERVLESRVGDVEVPSLVQLIGGVDRLVAIVHGLLLRLADDGGAASELALPVSDAADIEATLQALLEHARDLLGDPRLGVAAEALLAAQRGGDLDALEGAVGELCAVTKTGKRSPAAEAFFEYRDELPTVAGGANNRDRGRALVRRWRARERVLPRASVLKEILVACEAEIAKDNTRDSVLGFADVLRTARDVLRDHPDLAAETGAPLHALLVDEFQDTSGVQRDLVQLVWERRDEGKPWRLPGIVPSAADVRREGLLVVGDRKQSIYAFRGADAAVFAELCVGLAGERAREALAIPKGIVPEPAHPSADFIALRHNRRGGAELLDFANAHSRLSLVPEARPAKLFEVDYVAATEDLLSPAPESPSPKMPRTHWLRVAVPPGKQGPSRLAQAAVIAARIGCIVRGEELTVRGAPARWRDIAVLALRHDMLAATAYTLAEAGIPHVVAGMGFYGAREVRDVVAMLACLIDPDDSLARAEVLRGVWGAVTDRTLIGLTDRHAGLADVGRWQVGERRQLVDVSDRAAVEHLGHVIASLRPVVGRIGAGAALREASRVLQLEETLILMPRGEQRVANVRKVLGMADAATDPTAFVQRLRRAASAEQREGEAATFSEEDDAVRLLTVHASKGLAFPIVFLPEVGAAGTGQALEPIVVQTGVAGAPSALCLRLLDDFGAIHDTPAFVRVKRDCARRDAAERRRLRYVSITRASEAMFFVGDRALPKASRDAYESSTASILARLCEDETSCDAAQLTLETGDSLLRTVDAEEDAPPLAEPPRRVLPALPARAVTVRAEALADAAHCTRLYQLVHAIGFGSTYPSDLSTRSFADLTETLSLAGDWGGRVVAEGARLSLGERVVLVVRSGNGPELFVEGVIDLAVEWPDGATDLVCFRAASARPLVDGLYASLLAHAAEVQHPAAAGFRVGFLREDMPSEPEWMAPHDRTLTETFAREAAGRLLAAPHGDLAPRIPLAECGRLGCVFVDGCYGASH